MDAEAQEAIAKLEKEENKARKEKLKESKAKAEHALSHGSLSRLDPAEVDKSLTIKRREKPLVKQEEGGGASQKGAESEPESKSKSESKSEVRTKG